MDKNYAKSSKGVKMTVLPDCQLIPSCSKFQPRANTNNIGVIIVIDDIISPPTPTMGLF